MFNGLASLIFCFRNGYKTSNGDYARAGATAAQGAGLVTEIAKQDSIFGRIAGKVIESCDKIAKSDKAFNLASKTVKLASENVNTVIGLAGVYKTLTAEDKKSEAIIQGSSFLGMLGAEGWMKSHLKEGLSFIPAKGRWGTVLTGLTFVTGSIAASTICENLGRKVAKHIKEKEEIPLECKQTLIDKSMA